MANNPIYTCRLKASHGVWVFVAMMILIIPAPTYQHERNSGVGAKVVVGASGKKESTKSPLLPLQSAKKAGFQIYGHQRHQVPDGWKLFEG